MIQRRQIKQSELELVEFLVKKAGFDTSVYPVNPEVYEYEGGKMGSISMGKENAIYDTDLIQCRYTDSDNIPVIITLTKDTDNNLLDLDFWKEDFSKLLAYPHPEQVEIISIAH